MFLKLEQFSRRTITRDLRVTPAACKWDRIVAHRPNGQQRYFVARLCNLPPYNEDQQRRLQCFRGRVGTGIS